MAKTWKRIKKSPEYFTDEYWFKPEDFEWESPKPPKKKVKSKAKKRIKREKRRSKKADLYERIISRTGCVCGICEQSMELEYKELLEYRECIKRGENYRRPRTHIDITIDHIIPISKFKNLTGSKWQAWKIGNLQLAHKNCNNMKGDKTMAELQLSLEQSKIVV